MPVIPPPPPGAHPCPQCASKGIESYLRMNYEPELLRCARHPNCRFQIFFAYYGKELLDEEIKQLCESGQTDVIEGFLSKEEQRPFSARLILGQSTGWKVRPLFDNQ